MAQWKKKCSDMQEVRGSNQCKGGEMPTLFCKFTAYYSGEIK